MSAEGRAEVIVEVAAPLAEVRARWTNEGLATWVWRDGAAVSFDVTSRVGAAWSIEDPTGSRLTGTVLDSDDDLFVTTWRREGDGPDGEPEDAGVLTVTFALAALGTQVRIVQTAAPENVAQVQAAWERSLRRLVELYSD